MVARSRVVTAVLALTVASAAIGCGALIGIEDGVADPGTSGADATTTVIDGASLIETGAHDASMPDTSPTPDAAPTPGPIGKPGGSPTSLPCGGATCAIPAESCCAYRTTGSQPAVYNGICAMTCAPPGTGTDRLAVLKCSGPANCPATTPRCCLPIASTSAATTCRTSCDFQTEVTLCDPGGTNTCGSTRFCQHFSGNTMPPSWGYCN